MALSMALSIAARLRCRGCCCALFQTHCSLNVVVWSLGGLGGGCIGGSCIGICDVCGERDPVAVR